MRGLGLINKLIAIGCVAGVVAGQRLQQALESIFQSNPRAVGQIGPYPGNKIATHIQHLFGMLRDIKREDSHATEGMSYSAAYPKSGAIRKALDQEPGDACADPIDGAGGDVITEVLETSQRKRKRQALAIAKDKAADDTSDSFSKKERSKEINRIHSSIYKPMVKHLLSKGLSETAAKEKASAAAKLKVDQWRATHPA
ncbi:unnamed protein product [Prorocentrum cordatum]|uniref:Uncharacterized protein n=1 Tax=Prorocentrum cordatum TaxID=2364126 RepID=A0ABN9W741_9DINO|nr:unnamed protein product [Polarella glacialis]CAK0911343.1 unnamed protein product [Polarella glacialis]